jgi:hypothetical protein
MSLLKNFDDLFENGQVGDWAFSFGEAHIAIRLPTDFCILPIADDARVHWNWDGNREAPTLTPSILHHSTPEWHGYLTAGKLVIA